MGLGIKIKDKKYLSQQMADWEYKTISARWSVKSRLSGTAKMGLVWRVDAFMYIYERNPARTRLPFGEDGWSGLIARQKGWHIIQDSNNFVETFAPTRFFYNLADLDLGCASAPTQISGYDATNMWKQRTLRWYRNCLKRVPLEFFLCLTYNVGSVTKNIFYRFHNFRICHGNPCHGPARHHGTMPYHFYLPPSRAPRWHSLGQFKPPEMMDSLFSLTK
mmetsp:Transcript_4648/g.6878  ORF Transcript_4648/g.6878 Transcript_4648/m.6878 type:complete len:219 (-) Transcript_4648:22-678(-)